MKYTVSYQQPTSHLIDFHLLIESIASPVLELQLSAWRPGRYELQHFAKNIFTFEVADGNGKALPFRKTTKDRWQVEAGSAAAIHVKYSYYAVQMDAGGTWLDAEQLYINWVTCALAVVGREHEPYEIDLRLPDDYKIASALAQKGHTLRASNFFELIDSPTIASPTLRHYTYQIGKSSFHLWFQGIANVSWPKIKGHFEAFTKAQIEAFGGDFPCENYHFLYQILPYRHYHGVEHSHSTMIVLGPSEELEGSLYNDFLGVSSHELYHTWNIMRLRPAEMVPYRLEGENYFQTGFVVEGVTTYYGDLMLRRAGIWDDKAYLDEINVLFRRHFENFARYTASLTDSSFDLWLDGYQNRLPKRVVSIYVKGALVALIADLLIRKETGNRHSLDSVMKDMWEAFGRQAKGYTMAGYRQAVAKYLGESQTQRYFDECISGTALLESHWLPEALRHVGLQLVEKPAEKLEERYFGFRVAGNKVQLIDPDSEAYGKLEIGDELVAVNGRRVEGLQSLLRNVETLDLTLFRYNILKTIRLERGGATFFKSYELSAANEGASGNLKQWLGGLPPSL